MLGISAYAPLEGILLLVTAALGLWGWNWNGGEIYYHAAVGLTFLSIGFLRLESKTVRQLVGGMGVLGLVVKVVVILGTWLSPMRYLHNPIEVTCLIVGLASILAARYLPDQTHARSRKLD